MCFHVKYKSDEELCKAVSLTKPANRLILLTIILTLTISTRSLNIFTIYNIVGRILDLSQQIPRVNESTENTESKLFVRIMVNTFAKQLF